MASKVRRMIYRGISRSERYGSKPVLKCSFDRIRLKNRLDKKETQDLLPLLLRVMDLFLCLSKDYQKNIENFEGQYVLATRDDSSRSGVIFDDGYMKIPEEDILFPDVKITFKDLESLLRFILSKDQDLLELVLQNGIEINGNCSLALKFWYMVREMKQRLGLEK